MGRLGFHMLVSSIKERNKVSLSQKTVAVKGFVQALQLVLVEAVPALTEIVHVNGSSSDSEGECDTDECTDSSTQKITVSPGHAKDVHLAEQTLVDCIIANDGETIVNDSTFAWSDDEEDPEVGVLMKLIGDEHEFTSSMFVGGVTTSDVEQMQKDAKDKVSKQKASKGGGTTEELAGGGNSQEGYGGEGYDIAKIAELVGGKVKDDLG